MKRRNMVVLSMMLFVVLLIGGGTFAWFTAQADPIVNEFEAGTMGILIHEEFEPVDNVNPGDCYEKVIYVENTGTKRAYIRILAEAVFDGGQSTDVLQYGINESGLNWSWWGGWYFVDGWHLEDDGYFYYSKVVEPGHFTAPLLKCNRICFNGPMMDNEYQGASLDITINAEAIQATHNAVTEVWGVSFPTVRTVEAQLTLRDVEALIAQEEAAFEALRIQ